MKRILVAPLNWGLGHAARCVPLVRALEALGAEVLLASDGAALRLLREEFPHLPAFRIPSYRIRYKSTNMVWNIARQLPRLVWAIRTEQWATERLVREHGIQGIISDNRYGCFSRQAHSVMLTHQLQLRIPAPSLSWSANRMLRMALARFDAVWVPDAAGEPSLSGELSHSEKAIHRNVAFIGLLSRMQAREQDEEYDVGVVLSGPEPQRTILEQRLLEQAMLLPQKFIFIQGKTREKRHYFAADNVEVVSYLTSAELNDVLLASRMVVCRSGYSSLMDLAMLGKKALIIPTPGQTEQEYLAARLGEDAAFLVQSQENIDLETGLEAALSETHGLPPDRYSATSFQPVLEKWLANLS